MSSLSRSSDQPYAPRMRPRGINPLGLTGGWQVISIKVIRDQEVTFGNNGRCYSSSEASFYLYYMSNQFQMYLVKNCNCFDFIENGKIVCPELQLFIYSHISGSRNKWVALLCCSMLKIHCSLVRVT